MRRRVAMRLDMRSVKLGVFALVFLFIGVAIGASFSTRHEAQPNITFGDFIRDVDAGKVVEITISGQQVSGVYRDKTGFQTYIPPGTDNLGDKLFANGVKVTARR
jgi:cell division protease FtsH